MNLEIMLGIIFLMPIDNSSVVRYDVLSFAEVLNCLLEAGCQTSKQ